MPASQAIVLRYGLLYGPGTWADGPGRKPALHVDAAAQAALLAVTRGKPGIYNIADDDGAVSIEKARRELGFDPDFRLALRLERLAQKPRSLEAVAPGHVGRLGDADPPPDRDLGRPGPRPQLERRPVERKPVVGVG